MENRKIKLKRRIKIKLPEKKSITIKKVLAHIEKMAEEKHIPTPHSQLLKEILHCIPKINFAEEAELEEGSVRQKHIVVTIIEQLFKIVKRHGWRIAKKNGFIYLYNGAFWSVLNADELKKFLGECAEKMGVNKIDAKYHLFRVQLEKQFDAVGYFPAPDKGIKIIINLKNGTFEIDGKYQRLRKPNPDDFLKYQLPFPFDENETAPKWQAFLDRVVPDKQIQEVLQEYIGYVFTHLNLETVLLLYGNGANGKSVFIDVISAMLGNENVSSYSLESLTKTDSYSRPDLQNKLLNVANEISGRLQSDIFKSLASGQPVEARVIFKEPFTMTDYAKLLFACNELPREVEHTEGFFRRWIVIPFDQTIPKDEQNIDLAKEIIAEELSGVFNWALIGLKRLLVNKKFTVCEAIEKQNAEFRKQTDSVAMWMEEHNYVPSNQVHDELKRLFDEYNGFCRDCNYRAVGRTKFSERLRKAGFEIVKKNSGRIVYIEQVSVEENDKK